MSHPAIEQYLAQLVAAWPADEQREVAISELRDHLLATYEDALAEGANEEDAIQATLVECGDVASLVRTYRGNFSSQESRWMMRLSTAALAAGVLAIIGLATFWPGEHAPPLVAQAQAQFGGEGGTAAGGAPGGRTTVISDAMEVNNATTKTKLAKPMAIDFVETPLADVIAFIADKAGIETYINKRTLDEAGVALDSPITISLKQVRGDMLLELVLQQVGGDQIDYTVRDGIVVITDVVSLDGASEVKAYPVSDLLKLHATEAKREGGGELGGGAVPGGPGAPMGSGGFPPGGGGVFSGGGLINATPRDVPQNVQQLINVLQNTVSPDSWSDAGGYGTVTYYGEMLVVRQNARTHREIDKVLTMLRETASKKNVAN